MLALAFEPRRFCPPGALSISLLLAALATLLFCLPLPASSTGLLVPAYFYPSWWDAQANQWDELAEAAAQVPLVAIVNPASGPGAGPNSDYTREVGGLRAAGGRVIGYVYTAYGVRPLQEVLAEVDAYYSWYAVDGIYFDAASSSADPALVAYYQACHDHVREQDGQALVVLGQGGDAAVDYAASSTQILVFQGDDQLTPFADWQPPAWTAGYPAGQFTAFAYNVSDAQGMQAALEHAVANNVDWVYMTDDAGANPWDRLPIYWEEEVAALGALSAPAQPALLVPAYFYPSWWDAQANYWDELIEAAAQVPLVAIMNPASGPGAGPNADYTREVNGLRAAGGRVVGYVPTTYAARPLQEALAEVDAYYAWYAVDGIYFDESANSADPEVIAYYRACYDYVRSLDGQALVVLGQGTVAPEDYAAASTQLAVFEGDDQLTPFLDWQSPSWMAGYPARHFSVFLYGVSDEAGMRAAVDHAAANNVGWIYATDDAGANPWDTLPSYWQQQVAYLSGASSLLASVEDRTETTLDYPGTMRRRRVKIGAQVANISSTPLAGPLLLVVESTTDASVSPSNADGLTEAGLPYYDLSGRMAGAVLEEGESSAAWTMEFSNPKRVAFRVQTHLYQQRAVPAAKAAAPALATALPSEGYRLEVGYPNPFNASTHIAYELPREGEVGLVVLNALGQSVRQLVRQVRPAGRHTAEWNGLDDAGRPVASGVYFYRLQSGGFAQTRPLLLLK